MIQMLRKMDTVMPLELWGIGTGLFVGWITFLLFLILIDYYQSKKEK
jgi:hypothetical protein